MESLRMPAEWERHEGTWLAWPKNELTFQGEVLEKVRKTYLRMIREIASSEKVLILVDSEESKQRITKELGTNNIYFFNINYSDVWVRDYGPIFVKDWNDVIAVKWKFNSWGKKYDDLLYDDITGLEIAKLSGKKIIQTGIVLEGGAIDVNGEGICLTTASCLLNKNRNKIGREEMIAYLRKYIGAKDVIFLQSRIKGDDTDGHVDNVARFIDSNTVLVSYSREKEWKFSEKNVQTIISYSNEKGRKIELYKLPVPRKKGGLPLSYANFYITNEKILVPVFNDKNDEQAISTISQLTNRKVVGIECNDLLHGFGGIHCVTQQQPV